MTATSHAILGTVIAAKIGNPALAIPIALLSHIAADAFPHWDTGTNGRKKTWKRLFIESFFDVFLGFLISFILISFLFPQTNILYALLIILAAQSFDWLTVPYYFFHVQKFKWAYKFQKLFDNKLDKPWGIINQVLILLFIVIIAKAL